MLVKKIIPLNSLDTSVLIYITDDVKKAIRKLNKDGFGISINNIHQTTQGLTGYTIIDNKSNFYSVIRIEPSLKETLKLTVHEMYHANQDVLENREVKYKKGDANEIYAYTIDYLFGEVYDLIIKCWNKKYGE